MPEDNEMTEVIKKIAEEIVRFSPAQQIKLLQSVKKELADAHTYELTSHEKRSAELKQLIADIKGV